MLGLVVAGGVEGELAELFAGVAVDDADVEVGDEDDDGGSGVASADADVVEAAVVSEGHDSCGVDGVAADSVDGVGVAVGGPGFDAGGVGVGGGAAADRAVGAVVVVEIDEGVDLGLEPGDRGGWGLFGQVALFGLVESFDLAAGLGVVGP